MYKVKHYSENRHDGNLVDSFEVDQTRVLDLVLPMISLIYNDGNIHIQNIT